MSTQTKRFCEKPAVRQHNARFSSGPFTKHPAWNPSQSAVIDLIQRHRAITEKSRLEQVIRFIQALEFSEECIKESV